jgi:hypothetical protein
MKIITRRSELAEFAEDYGLAYDWHRTGLSARVEGTVFGSIGNWPAWATTDYVEQHVILTVDPVCSGECGQVCDCDLDPVDVAAVNLATLLAWASGTMTV